MLRAPGKSFQTKLFVYLSVGSKGAAGAGGMGSPCLVYTWYWSSSHTQPCFALTLSKLCFYLEFPQLPSFLLLGKLPSIPWYTVSLMHCMIQQIWLLSDLLSSCGLMLWAKTAATCKLQPTSLFQHTCSEPVWWVQKLKPLCPVVTYLGPF